MINEPEKELLLKYYPELVVSADYESIVGTISFIASYDKGADMFQIINKLNDAPSTENTLILGSTFNITITKNKDDDLLPNLSIQGDLIERSTDRHFYISGDACLCGLVENVNFKKSNMGVLEFIERLVIPFLYGQLYFDKFNKWPWKEYAHNTAGILQSFHCNEKTIENAMACLEKLKKVPNQYPVIKRVFIGQERFTGVNKCFCGSGKEVRFCHLDTWYGLLELRSVLTKSYNLTEIL